ncbi:MAG: hypothetical protein V7L23_34555 [Nostoc sp.]|uniref:hypothetical protein n=1 Tax=Nostoc sp. TaxID=1180 RepID=UPI002FF03B24
MILDENESYSTDRRRVGGFNAISQGDGIEGSGRVNQGNIEQADTPGTDVQSRDSSPGKLLGRLELLEKAFYGYVHGHQERLKTRFRESTELESAFTEELQAIKRGLRDLAQQVEDDEPE